MIWQTGNQKRCACIARNKPQRVRRGLDHSPVKGARMAAQIVHGLSNEEYQKHPAISKSKLDAVARSPFHYHAEYMQPEPPKREEKPQFKFGTLAHCAVLEPAEVQNRYALAPDWFDARTVRGKEWLQTVGHGQIIISTDQMLAASRVDASLKSLPDIADLLKRGRPEVSVFITDDATGLDLKCRPDWVHDCDDDGVILMDVKTSMDASPREFARSVAKFRYHVQAAYYSDLYQKASGKTVHAFVFAVAESAFPHAAACYTLDAVAMAKGRELYRHNLNTLKLCYQENNWPAYGAAMQELMLPTWAANF